MGSKSRLQVDTVFFSPTIGPVVAPEVYPPGIAAGGSETQTWKIARGLAARGRSVAVVVRGAPPAFPGTKDGVTFLREPKPGNSRLAGYAAHIRLATRLLREWDPKVIVQRAAGPATGVVAGIAAAGRRPFVYSSAHVVDFDFSALETNRRRVKMFEWGVRRACEIVVQTAEQSELCRRRYGRPGVVVKSVAEDAPPRSEEPTAFLWIGRPDGWKNPLAFVELARSMPEAQFEMVVVPSANVRLGRQVQQRASELPNLTLLAPRPRHELLRLLDHAVAVVNTSTYEGIPNVFLEAWAAGIPALALSHDPDGVIVRHGLGGFAEGDEERLTELASAMWAERRQASGFDVACRAYVRNEHSLDAAIDRWSQVLDSCAKRS